jgi:hypothetical protein
MTQFSIHWILSLNRLCQKWGQVQSINWDLKRICNAAHEKQSEHKTASQLAAHTAKSAVIMAKVGIRQAIADNPCPAYRASHSHNAVY